MRSTKTTTHTYWFAGVVYPRGNSDEDQYQALSSIMTQSTYRFAEMVVPRAIVDT